MNNVFALRRPTFTFKYHPNLCKQKSSNYGSLQFQAWICIIFHGRNLYEFQRSKPFSKLHLLYLYPLNKQSFPNYNQNTRRSSLRTSRSILVSQTASKQVHSFYLRLSGAWRKIPHALLGNSAHTYARTPLKLRTLSVLKSPCECSQNQLFSEK